MGTGRGGQVKDRKGRGEEKEEWEGRDSFGPRSGPPTFLWINAHEGPIYCYAGLTVLPHSGGRSHSECSLLPTHGGMAQAESTWVPGSLPGDLPIQRRSPNQLPLPRL